MDKDALGALPDHDVARPTPDEALTSARSAAARGDSHVALAFFEQAFSAAPLRGDIALALGYHLRGMRRFDDARCVALDLVTAKPGLVPALLLLSRIEHDLGDTSTAVEHLERAARLQPDNVNVKLELARQFRALGRTDDSAAKHREILELDPAQPTSLMALGEIARANGDFAAALQHFSRLVEAQPEQIGARLRMAIMMRRLGRNAEARGLLEDLQARRPDDPEIMLELARSAREAGDHKTALGLSEALRRLRPDSQPIAQDHVRDLLALDRLDAAQSLLSDELAKAEVIAPWVYMQLAEIARRRGDEARAFDLYSELARLVPDDPQPRLAGTNALIRLGRHREAAEHIEALLRQAPQHPGVHLAVGTLARAVGNLAHAAEAFSSYLALQPDALGVRLQLAECLLALGRMAEATARLDFDPASQEQRWRRAHLLGRIAEAEGQTGLALDRYAEAQSLKPGDPNVLRSLVGLYRQKGDWDAVHSALQAAYAAEPESQAVILQIVEFLVLQRHFDEAIALLRRKLARRPDAVQLAIRLSGLLAGGGDIDAARGVLGALPHHVAGDAAVRRQEAILLAETGAYSDALALLAGLPEDDIAGNLLAIELALAAGDDRTVRDRLTHCEPAQPANRIRVHVARAQLSADDGDLDSAFADFDAALSLDPGNINLHRQAAMLAVRRLDMVRLEGHLTALLARTAPAQRMLGRSVSRLAEFSGTIHNEFSIDKALLARVLATREVAGADGLAELAALVRANSQYLAPSLEFIERSLAGSPTPVAPPARVTGGALGIPRIITQFWDEPDVPDDLLRYIDTWRSAEGFEHRLFSYATARKTLGDALGERHVRAFRSLRFAQPQADYFRLAALFLWGGIHADADSMRRLDPEAFLPAGCNFLAYREATGAIASGIIACAPRHPIIETALELATQSALDAEADSSWFRFGPGLLTRACARFLAEAERPGTVPREMFICRASEVARFAALRRKASHKQSGRPGPNAAVAKASFPMKWLRLDANDEAESR
ncbi:MAG: tetratricopeptide repeat protein [Hyphomicrobiaceae bacterium]